MARSIPRNPSLWPAVFGGLTATALSETRHPIISKVEIVFSLVSHHSHVGSRVDFYNNYGEPRGNLSYAVPHLVYEPVVTLYNP